MSRLFISGTGTGVGKTWLTRGLARALVRRGIATVAIKPIETGCEPDPRDAIALARACDRPELADAPGLYRAHSPVAPYAASLEGEPRASLSAIAEATDRLCPPDTISLIEGAGGLMVPLDATHDMADLARALDAELVLVGVDGLGVLSHVLTAAAARRTLRLRAVVLTALRTPEPSQRTNAHILRERLACPVVPFPAALDDDDALATAAAPVLTALGIASGPTD